MRLILILKNFVFIVIKVKFWINVFLVEVRFFYLCILVILWLYFSINFIDILIRVKKIFYLFSCFFFESFGWIFFECSIGIVSLMRIIFFIFCSLVVFNCEGGKFKFWCVMFDENVFLS